MPITKYSHTLTLIRSSEYVAIIAISKKQIEENDLAVGDVHQMHNGEPAIILRFYNRSEDERQLWGIRDLLGPQKFRKLFDNRWLRDRELPP